MNTNELNIGDVVVMNNQDIMVVSGIETNRPKNPIVVQKKVGKEYICSPSTIVAVIGSVDLDKLNASKSARVKVNTEVANLILPQKLKDMGLEVGVSQIRVRHAGKIINATFTNYVPSRWKYPVSYQTVRGGRYKCSLDNILGKV